jgi:hypothetical protein
MVIMILVAIMTIHTMSMLVRGKQELVANNVPVVTFGNIMGHLYGRWGQVLVDILLVFTQVRQVDPLSIERLTIVTLLGRLLLRVRGVFGTKCVAVPALGHELALCLADVVPDLRALVVAAQVRNNDPL